MSAAASIQPDQELKTFHMSIFSPGLGLIHVDVKSVSLAELVEFWWELGYVDGVLVETGTQGRFARDKGSHFFVRPEGGAIKTPQKSILVPR